MTTDTEPDLDRDLGYIRKRAARHAVPGTGLWDFAHGGPTTDPVQLAADIRERVAAVADRPAHDACIEDDLDELYGLEMWVESYRIHFHLGHNEPGYLPDEAPICVLDPAEAVAAFLAMAREFADTDDEAAEEHLLATAAGDDYPCGCGHDATEHSETQPLPCQVDDCGCEGYQPDWGDDTPNTRATVDAVLAEEPPEPGKDYAMSVVDAEGWRREFFLHVVVLDNDTATCAGEVAS